MQTAAAPPIHEHEKPGLFERAGLWYFHRLLNRDAHETIHQIPDNDDVLVKKVKRVTWIGAAGAFAIGAVSAAGSVWTEIIFDAADDIVKYSWVGGVTLVLTLIEFAVLFYVSIRVVYAIAKITGHNTMALKTQAVGVVIPNLLARAALEIPDPVMELFGIDPMARVSKKKMLLVGLLYKAKIAASNVVAKLFLRRVLGKAGIRVAPVPWVTVPITGLWNGIVTFKVAREARLRLFGNLLAHHISENVITPDKLARLSPRAREGCMQAVGNSVVLTQGYHPNMLILLLRIAKLVGAKDTGASYGDWEKFLDTLRSVSAEEKAFLLDLLAVATAFDGKLSKLEKKMLPEAFGEHNDIYFARINTLKELMVGGRLNAAKAACSLDFVPG